MDQHLNDDEEQDLPGALGAFEGLSDPARYARPAAPAGYVPDGVLEPSALAAHEHDGASFGGALPQASAGAPAADAGQSWIDEEFSEDFDEGDGSWLMSLDDDVGDRPGFDPITEDAVEDSFLEPAALQASWHEEPSRKGVLARTLLPLAALSIVAMVGVAGWRVLEMRSIPVRNLEALPPQFDLKTGRIIAPSSPGVAAPVMRREVIGQRSDNPVVDPDDPNAERPNAVPRGSAAFAALANPNGARPNFAGAWDVDRRPERAPRERLDGPRLRERLADRPSEGSASQPSSEDRGFDLARNEQTALDPEPAANQDSASLLAGVQSPTPEVSGRWRRWLGIDVAMERGGLRPSGEFRRDEGVERAPSERVARGQSYVREDEVDELPTGLPYGLDAAFIEGWSPPLAELERENEGRGPRIGVVRSATFSDMPDVWSQPEVPFDAIAGEARLRTPAVGYVAVTLESGVVLDGTLHSVGQGNIWLDDKFGRTTLKHERVRRITQLQAANAARGIEIVQSLERVRVRSAGGVLFGHVLAHDDEREQTTVVTDGGSRITVPSHQVDHVGTLSNVLLKRG